MFVWLFLAWCVAGVVRDFSAPAPTTNAQRAVLYVHGVIALLVLVALVFFPKSL